MGGRTNKRMNAFNSCLPYVALKPKYSGAMPRGKGFYGVSLSLSADSRPARTHTWKAVVDFVDVVRCYSMLFDVVIVAGVEWRKDGKCSSGDEWSSTVDSRQWLVVFGSEMVVNW